MSTWKEILYAFDIAELRAEAAGIIDQALASFSPADAVKTLIALTPQAETEAQRQGVAEAIAGRLDGALAWSLVHINRRDEPMRSVLDRAIFLRIYGAPPEEEAQLIWRGLDEDPELYGSLLIDAVRRHPIEAHREIASYVVWKDTRLPLTTNGVELSWRSLRRELESLLGTDLPPFQESVRARDSHQIRETLKALPLGEELSGAYRIMQETQGMYLGILAEYLTNWAFTQEDWEPLREASNYPADDPVGKLARTALNYLYVRATPAVSASTLHAALDWAIRYDQRMSLGFFLVLTEHLARSKPSVELWIVAPLLRNQIALETRYPLKTRLGIQKDFDLTDRGKSFQNALTALESCLPDPALPQPADSSVDYSLLPRPSEAGTFDAASLPTPATEVLDGTSDPRWKRWTKKFKR